MLYSQIKESAHAIAGGGKIEVYDSVLMTENVMFFSSLSDFSQKVTNTASEAVERINVFLGSEEKDATTAAIVKLSATGFTAASALKVPCPENFIGDYAEYTEMLLQQVKEVDEAVSFFTALDKWLSYAVSEPKYFEKMPVPLVNSVLSDRAGYLKRRFMGYFKKGSYAVRQGSEAKFGDLFRSVTDYKDTAKNLSTLNKWLNSSVMKDIGDLSESIHTRVRIIVSNKTLDGNKERTDSLIKAVNDLAGISETAAFIAYQSLVFISVYRQIDKVIDNAL